jgi:ribonuclease P protein component
MKKLIFNKASKLLKTDEFSSVFNFKKRYTSEFLVIHFHPNDKNHTRLGLVVGKKIAKSAVSRNYMRRAIRECFRTHECVNRLQMDIVVRVQKPFNPLHYSQIKRDFNQFVMRLNAKIVV